MYEYNGSSTIKDIYIHVNTEGKTSIKYQLNLERSRTYCEHELFSNYDELIKYIREKTQESFEKAEKLYSEFEALPEVYSEDDLIEYCVINNKNNPE